mgnify:CR=1 FL=1
MPRRGARGTLGPKRLIEERRAEIDWILDYHDDVTSDLSALHGVADWRALDSVTFFSLARRLHAYPGAMRARLFEEIAREREEAKRVADAASASDALAELERDGWLSRE